MNMNMKIQNNTFLKNEATGQRAVIKCIYIKQTTFGNFKILADVLIKGCPEVFDTMEVEQIINLLKDGTVIIDG